MPSSSAAESVDDTIHAPTPAPAAPPTLWAALRTLPRTAWLLYLGTFLNRFASFVLAFLGLYPLSLGVPAGHVGLILGLYGTGAVVATQVGGWLADHWSRRATIALSMSSSAAVVLTLAWTTAPALVAVLALLAGFTGEFYRPASSAILADLTPSGQRVPVYAAYRLAINAGTGLGVASGGLLATHSFRWLFAADALSSLTFAVVAIVYLRDTPRPPADRRTRSLLAGLRALGTDRPFAMLVGASLLIAVVFDQFTVAIPLRVHALSLSTATYGLLMSLNGITCAVLELPLASVTRRLPPRSCVAAGYLLLGIGMSLMGLARSVFACAACVVAWTLGEILSSAVMTALIADIAPTGLQARYQGILGLTYALGMALAPALGAPIFSWHPAVLWSGCAIVGGCAATLVRFARSTPAPP